jgi:hypothetical protein
MEMRMSDGYRMRERHEEIKTKEKVMHPISGEAVGFGGRDRSLEEIFNDRRETDLFLNLYLHKRNPQLAQQITRKRAAEPKSETLSEAEEAFLEGNRESFNILRAESDILRGLLDESQMKYMKRADKDLDEVVGMIGPANAARLFGDQLEEVALTDEPRFRRMIDSLKAAHEIQNSKTAERRESRIVRLLAKYGVSKEQYDDATAPGFAPETRENLAELTRGQLKGWRAALDYVSFGAVSKWRAGWLTSAFVDREQLLQEADMHLASVIKVLRGTLSSEEIKRSYQNQGFAEGTPERLPYTILSIRDYRRVRSEFAIDKIEGDFKKYRAEEAKKLSRNKNQKNWEPDGTSNLTADEKTKIADAYLKDKKGKRGKESARGLMKVLMDEIFTSTYDADLEAKVRSLT